MGGATLRGVEWGGGFRADDLYQSAWKYFYILPTGLADSSTWLSAPGLGSGEELVGGSGLRAHLCSLPDLEAPHDALLLSCAVLVVPRLAPKQVERVQPVLEAVEL